MGQAGALPGDLIRLQVACGWGIGAPEICAQLLWLASFPGDTYLGAVLRAADRFDQAIDDQNPDGQQDVHPECNADEPRESMPTGASDVISRSVVLNISTVPPVSIDTSSVSA
jgi:hypothetical protein